jgi:hypothetical protein
MAVFFVFFLLLNWNCAVFGIRGAGLRLSKRVRAPS